MTEREGGKEVAFSAKTTVALPFFFIFKSVPRNKSKPMYNLHLNIQVYKSPHETLNSAVNIGL